MAHGPRALWPPVVSVPSVLGRHYRVGSLIRRTCQKPGLGAAAPSGVGTTPQACQVLFFQTEVRYLGHIISCDGVATDPEKTDKVAAWPVPTCKREVQQFVGFANYYRHFIRDFAQLARPLHRLTEQTAPFLWSENCQESFDMLRRGLSSSPVLAYPDFTRLDTDASDVGIGGVLSQLDDEGRERVVA